MIRKNIKLDKKKDKAHKAKTIFRSIVELIITFLILMLLSSAWISATYVHEQTQYLDRE